MTLGEETEGQRWVHQGGLDSVLTLWLSVLGIWAGHWPFLSLIFPSVKWDVLVVGGSRVYLWSLPFFPARRGSCEAVVGRVLLTLLSGVPGPVPALPEQTPGALWLPPQLGQDFGGWAVGEGAGLGAGSRAGGACWSWRRWGS